LNGSILRSKSKKSKRFLGNYCVPLANGLIIAHLKLLYSSILVEGYDKHLSSLFLKIVVTNLCGIFIASFQKAKTAKHIMSTIKIKIGK
jgi:hypothetical protein